MVKVELGCGQSKTDGFIGIDRFDLPGVDIVADLNAGIPLESDSVDVLYASHSLEHLADLSATMQEIYRVCKDGAIIIIVAPYGNVSADIANPYHNIPFNEHTFRFFTNHSQFLTRREELELPSLYGRWGLSDSDNSQSTMDFRTLDMRFVYFEEYNGLPEDVQFLLRQNLNNVCNMIVYSLCVCKEHRDIEPDEYEALKGRADSIIDSLPISKLIEHWQSLSVGRDTLYSHIMDCISQELASQRQSAQAAAAHQNRIQSLLTHESVQAYLQGQNAKFLGSLPKAIALNFSEVLGSEYYKEYEIRNSGGQYLDYYVETNHACQATIEIVHRGAIVYNNAANYPRSGIYRLNIGEYSGAFQLRFAANAVQGLRLLECRKCLRGIKYGPVRLAHTLA